ncbi:hypothetical protein, partial [Bradyrhizobium brasilense]|uniref:hypothetical protein n=1 Tax=Bradyrhizobium brasilense TaxID=1419277 RepID=UPI001E451F3B
LLQHAADDLIEGCDPVRHAARNGLARADHAALTSSSRTLVLDATAARDRLDEIGASLVCPVLQIGSSLVRQ